MREQQTGQGDEILKPTDSYLSLLAQAAGDYPSAVRLSPPPIPAEFYGEPHYLLINNGTRLGNTTWRGRVVIGVEAIYIFKESLEQLSGHPHGLVGAFVWLLYNLMGIFTQRLKPVMDIPGIPYGEIPESVRNHSAWPIQQPMDKQVVVIPRASVSVINREFGASEMEFEYAGVPIAVRWGSFEEMGIRDFLAATGWPLRWSGVLSWSGKLHNMEPNAASRLSKPPRPRIAVRSILLALFLAILSMFSQQLPPGFRDWAWVILIAAALLVGLFGVAALRRGI